jgi:hypothetical protein
VRNSAEDRATVWRVCFMLNLTSDHITAIPTLSALNPCQPQPRGIPPLARKGSNCEPACICKARQANANNVMTGDHAVHGYM